ncbi:hypothetical protein, partial [Streptomyces sp. WMMB 322]|uniref:hypothetical protein n=1 Tax=Streptomyces sp. WMMB 322 TaxID=1286821 RepID=UPI001C3146C2
LALTFGTLLSSQRTDASITTLTGRSGRFPLGDSNLTRELSESVCRTVELGLVADAADEDRPVPAELEM